MSDITDATDITLGIRRAARADSKHLDLTSVSADSTRQIVGDGVAKYLFVHPECIGGRHPRHAR